MQANLCRLGKSVKIKSLIPSAKQPRMDFFVTCAFIITIILYPHLQNISLKLCGDLNKSISISSKSTVSTAAPVKDCKVALEDISSCDVVKPKMLNTSQENTYTASSHLTKEKRLLKGFSVKTPIAWGKANDERWAQLDDIVYSKLKNCNSLTEWLDLLQNTIYNEAANIFGHFQPPKRNLAGQSRRIKLSIQLIKEKNLLTAQKNSIFLPDQQIALEQLLTDVKNKIIFLRKPEKSRRRHWLVNKPRNDFKANPYNAGKTLLDPKCYVNLKVEQADLDQHKSSSLIDINYNIPLADLEGLPDKPPLLKPFPTNCFSFEDFFQILSTRRNASAPGLNGIPYKVYKKCPKINKFLFKFFLSCMNKGVIPLQWQSAKEIYIPKVNPPAAHNISDFRPIALLNVEGKLFFILVSRLLKKHLISSNKFINTSVQKGCMEKDPGCWEHISMVWAALKETKSKNLSLASIWLDIVNTYGSIQHKLIIFALHRYGVSLKWIHLIKTYYSGTFSKSFCQEASSSWHRHQRGIFVGCTLTIIFWLV